MFPHLPLFPSTSSSFSTHPFPIVRCSFVKPNSLTSHALIAVVTNQSQQDRLFYEGVSGQTLFNFKKQLYYWIRATESFSLVGAV